MVWFKLNSLVIKTVFFVQVFGGNLCEGMKALGDKVRNAVKCTWANGNQHKEIPRKFGTDIGYRFK
jgi:hypothetical protein